jgi:uncharacterized protein involved in exopolysaccharide biosynthesis
MPNSHVRGNPDVGPVLTSTPPSGFDDRRLEDEVDFGVYARFLVRYWIPLVACALAGAVIGFAVAERRPTLYEAATTIIAHQGDAVVSAGTVRALLQNGTLASQTLRETGLDKPPSSLSPQAFIADAFRVDEVPGTNFLRITVTLSDPRNAAIASTTLARKAVDFSRLVSQEQSIWVRSRVKEQLEAAAQRLTDAERQLLLYQNEAQLELLQQDTDSMLDGREHLLKLLGDIESEKGRLAAAEKDIRNYQAVLPLKRSTSSEGARSGAATSENASVPNSPAATVDPDTLNPTEPVVNPIHQTLAVQIAMSRIRLAGLERERDEILSARKLGRDRVSKFSDLHRRELELARVQGNYDLAKQVHDALALRYEQAPIESLNKMVNLQVVDEAIQPDRPKTKKRAETSTLGMAIGLVLGALGAIAWESQRRSSARA